MTYCDQEAPPGFPDAGQRACCIGAAVYGPDRCTCWVVVHDLDQADPDPAAPATVRDGMCPDCAYRPGSPERSGDERAAGDAQALEQLAADGTPFWCHEGIRRPVAYRHEPTGTEVPAREVPGSDLAYRPPVIDGRPYRADGDPARQCAGWDARRRALATRAAKEKSA